MHYPLRFAIVRTGDTQRVIAADCRVSPVRLSRLVRGRFRMRPDEAQRLAARLDVPIELLLPAAVQNEGPRFQPQAQPRITRTSRDEQHDECTTGR